jgi:membrane protease YdiL (CAAX protease family)
MSAYLLVKNGQSPDFDTLPNRWYMVTTFILASLAPLAVFVGLLVFKNAFITFLLFHGFVCIGIPVIDLFVVKRYNHSDAAKSLGLVSNRNAIKVGACSGFVSLIVIVLFFYIFQDHVIKVDEMQSLLESWSIRKDHIFILLFVMIFANSVLEEVYWRGYIFGRMEAHFGATSVIILSSLFYASYHYVTTANLFSVQIGVLFTVVIFLAGIFWGTIRKRFGSLYASIISHLLVDLAIMIIYVAFVQQHIAG